MVCCAEYEAVMNIYHMVSYNPPPESEALNPTPQSELSTITCILI